MTEVLHGIQISKDDAAPSACGFNIQQPSHFTSGSRLPMSTDVQTGEKQLLQIGLVLPLHYPRNLLIPVSGLPTKSERKIFAATPQLLFGRFHLNWSVIRLCRNQFLPILSRASHMVSALLASASSHASCICQEGQQPARCRLISLRHCESRKLGSLSRRDAAFVEGRRKGARWQGHRDPQRVSAMLGGDEELREGITKGVKVKVVKSVKV
jgi:hypothetical protein